MLGLLTLLSSSELRIFGMWCYSDVTKHHLIFERHIFWEFFMKTTLFIRKVDILEHIFSVSAWPYFGTRLVLFPPPLWYVFVHVLWKSSKMPLTPSYTNSVPWPCNDRVHVAKRTVSCSVSSTGNISCWSAAVGVDCRRLDLKIMSSVDRSNNLHTNFWWVICYLYWTQVKFLNQFLCV